MNSTAFVDDSAHPTAVHYYGLFPVAPTPKSSVTVTRIVQVPSRSTEVLLATIAKNAKAGENIIIVGHGNETGLEFRIGDPRNFVYLQTGALRAILNHQAGNASDAETAKILMLKDESEYRKLRALIDAVQALKLNRVDLRACTVGKNEGTMYSLLSVFDCQALSAPKQWDNFGRIELGQPTPNPAVWREWEQKHPKAVVFGSHPNRFAYELQGAAGLGFYAMADSEGAVKAWIDARLPTPNKYSKGPIYYHALTDMKQKLIFAGEAEFRAQLVESTKGKDPRKADPNAPLPRP
jgi:hypothetical protein